MPWSNRATPPGQPSKGWGTSNSADEPTGFWRGVIKGVMDVVPGGVIRGGKQSFTDDAHTGFWLGVDTDGLGKFALGNASFYLKWDGTRLTMNGRVIFQAPATNDPDQGVQWFKTSTLLAYIFCKQGSFGGAAGQLYTVVPGQGSGGSLYQITTGAAGMLTFQKFSASISTVEEEDHHMASIELLADDVTHTSKATIEATEIILGGTVNGLAQRYTALGDATAATDALNRQTADARYAQLAGRAGGQTLIGGTGVTDVLALTGTAGNGTATSPAVQINVGNNGATNALTANNLGNVAIGSAVPDAKLLLSLNAAAVAPPAYTLLHCVAPNFQNARLVFDAHATLSGTAGRIVLRRSKGTAATPIAAASGNLLGAVEFSGYGATAFPATGNASLSAYAAEAYTDSAMGAYLTFLTTPIGSATAAERLRITDAGLCGIGCTPATLLHGRLSSAVTNAVSNVQTLEHATSGTAAAGFGLGLNLLLQSSTTAAQTAARLVTAWNVATHASRAADVILYVSDAAGEREVLRGRASGSAPQIGFLGVTPAAQVAHVADAKANYAAGELDTEAEIITALNAANAKINTLLATLETFGFHAAA